MSDVILSNVSSRAQRARERARMVRERSGMLLDQTSRLACAGAGQSLVMQDVCNALEKLNVDRF